jgi:hypothetical protein
VRRDYPFGSVANFFETVRRGMKKVVKQAWTEEGFMSTPAWVSHRKESRYAPGKCPGNPINS